VRDIVSGTACGSNGPKVPAGQPGRGMGEGGRGARVSCLIYVIITWGREGESKAAACESQRSAYMDCPRPPFPLFPLVVPTRLFCIPFGGAPRAELRLRP